MLAESCTISRCTAFCCSAFRFAAMATVVLLSAPAATADQADPAGRLVGLGTNNFSLAPFTPGQLFEIDPITGTETPIGHGYALEPQQIGLNLAADSHGRLYNIFNRFAQAPILHRLDPIDGQIVTSTPLHFGGSFNYEIFATAFDTDDRLHAIALNNSPNVDAIPVLIEIDTATGRVTFGQTVGSWDYTGLAAGTDGSLYAAAAERGLARIDVATGDTTLVGGDLGGRSPWPATPSLAFDGQGQLFAAASRLLHVDTSSGESIRVSDATFGVWTIVGMDFTAPPLVSDFDLDGHVGGGDFLTWQVGFGQFDGSARHTSGDANGDGLVDERDFRVWGREFGAGPALAAARSVPEPNSLAVLLFAIAMVMRLRFDY